MVTHKITLDGFQHENGFCYVKKINSPYPDLFIVSDGMRDNSISRLIMYEDNQPLGPAHSMHHAIRTEGEGRYSHWGPYVYLSTSDNSNPNENARVYSALYPLIVPASLCAVVYILFGLFVVAGLLKAFPSVWGLLLNRMLAFRLELILYAVLPASVLIIAMLCSDTSDYVFKVLFFLLAYFVLVFVLEALQGKSSSFVGGLVLTALALWSLLFPYDGAFEMAGFGSIAVESNTTVQASIYTQQDSSRWNWLKTKKNYPYLFFSLRCLDRKAEEQIELVVNDRNRGKLNDIPDLKRIVSGDTLLGYGLLLDEQTLFEKEFLDVQLVFNECSDCWLWSAMYELQDEFHKPHIVCEGEECRPLPEIYKQLRFVIEIRIVDEQDRVLGVLI